MKKLFWLLLLANVILFAVMQRGGLGWGEQEVRPQPELNADMIHLLPSSHGSPVKPMPATHAASPAPVLAPTTPAPAIVNAAKPAVVPPNPVSSPSPSQTLLKSASEETKPSKLICLEWGDFSGADLSRAKTVLSDLHLGNKIGQRQIEYDIGYWVYIPPLKNMLAVNRKITELKALGINEYFVVQTEGHWQNAISLGVFKTREAAHNYLHVLNAKGVRTARVGERASKLKTTVFTLNRVDPSTEENLKAIQKDFVGSELSNVPCGLTR
jgi:hypothetical protein